MLGRALIRRLVEERPSSVRALVRGAAQAAAFDDLPVEVRQVDYGNPISLADPLTGAAAVVHLAGRASASERRAA